MVTRRYRKKIESLQASIAEHQEKIRIERQKPQPDEGLITHWEQETRAFEDAIRRTKERLGR